MKKTKIFLISIIILAGVLSIWLFPRRGYQPVKRGSYQPVKEESRTSAAKVMDEVVYKDIKDLASGAIIIDGDIADWQAAGISPLENLEWSNIYNMPMFEDTRRIKSVRLAYDVQNLFLLLEIKPGVKERFDKKQTTGHIGYLYLDADGSSATGARRHIKDVYPGWDWRIYLPEGFVKKEGAPIEEIRPAAWYQIEKIKSYNEQEADYGTTFNCEYEELAGGNRASYDKPAYIAFGGDFVEMCFPFKLLGMKLPADIRLIVEDLNALPSAETRISGHLKAMQEKSAEQFSVSYYFSSELIYKDIEINQAQLSYTYFEDKDGKCKQWMRQAPCWDREDLRTIKTTLSADEVSDLIGLINQAGFMELETTYGGAGESQRYYLHKISVKIADAEKRVFYQGFPAASPMPQAFKAVKDRLFELINKKFNQN
ncbi:MAG: hypothetical protein V1674_04160 [Candidatus Omnitrophota bacterium]